MTSRPRAALLVLAYLAFISLGLPDGLLGVAWPAIRGDFAVATSAVGLVLTTTTIGFLASSVAAGFALSRLGVGWLLAASTGLVAFALIGYAVAPTFAPMVGFGLLLGIGSGAIDSGLNAYAASAFGPRHMNWLHAFFGLGVALGPLTMTAVLSLGFAWRWGYVLVAAAQLALAVAFASSHAAWSRGPRVAVGTSPPARRTLALPAVWFGALAFVVYTGVEVGAGLWAYLLLTEGRGLAGTVAGICVSAYWASLFIGRLVLGEVSERLGPPRVLPAGLAGMVAGAALVAMPTAVERGGRPRPHRLRGGAGLPAAHPDHRRPSRRGARRPSDRRAGRLRRARRRAPPFRDRRRHHGWGESARAVAVRPHAPAVRPVRGRDPLRPPRRPSGGDRSLTVHSRPIKRKPVSVDRCGRWWTADDGGRVWSRSAPDPGRFHLASSVSGRARTCALRPPPRR